MALKNWQKDGLIGILVGTLLVLLLNFLMQGVEFGTNESVPYFIISLALMLPAIFFMNTPIIAIPILGVYYFVIGILIGKLIRKIKSKQ